MEEHRITAGNGSSIVLYTTNDGYTQLEVKLENDTVWLTQSQMAELFGIDRTVISRHIRNIFKEEKLDESLVFLSPGVTLLLRNFALSATKIIHRKYKTNFEYLLKKRCAHGNTIGFNYHLK